MLGRVLYALLFVALLPALLVWWARGSARDVPLAPITYPGFGPILVVLGSALMIAGMTWLVVRGRGLPMNAYPPPRYVATGVYALTSHPIYLGFVLLCAGVSITAQSSSGLWLVTPIVALSIAALVIGYEGPELRRRFGGDRMHTPLLALPPNSGEPVRARDRAAVYLLVAVPWALAFRSVCDFGTPASVLVSTMPFERAWPVVEWTQLVYDSTYALVLAVPFVVRTRRALRETAVLGLIATAAVTFLYLTVPIVSPPRAFEASTLLGRLHLAERDACNTVAAFPSFHVIWALIAARAWGARSRAWGAVGWTWAALTAVSCLTTGIHTVADVVAAVAFFALLTRYRRVWETLRRRAEHLANSWHAWEWHGVRVINYAVYAAAAGAVGFWVSNALAGPDAWPALVLAHACGLLGAGAWAQQLEGSSRLSRPFGYYGGVLGTVAGIAIAGAFGADMLLLLAAIAVAGPWVQALGRLRCLVQGCCHGASAPPALGIVYRHPHSRVTMLSSLTGVPVHPTPLYSILANVVIGILLLRLWSLGAAYGLIAGVYLMLAGVSRFVEESVRGEPQTPSIAGLRLYQWMAILSLLSGIALTTVPGGHTAGLDVSLDTRALIGGLVFGLATGSAMGIDFPGSARRFARLVPS